MSPKSRKEVARQHDRDHDTDRRWGYLNGPERNAQPEAGGPLFPLGRIFATPGAITALEAAYEREGVTEALEHYLGRHAAGDWGDLEFEDRRENELSLKRGFRLFSAYNLPTSDRLWVITEADRSATTALLPSDY